MTMDDMFKPGDRVVVTSSGSCWYRVEGVIMAVRDITAIRGTFKFNDRRCLWVLMETHSMPGAPIYTNNVSQLFFIEDLNLK